MDSRRKISSISLRKLWKIVKSYGEGQYFQGHLPPQSLTICKVGLYHLVTEIHAGIISWSKIRQCHANPSFIGIICIIE